jgi:hypothetical protein
MVQYTAHYQLHRLHYQSTLCHPMRRTLSSRGGGTQTRAPYARSPCSRRSLALGQALTNLALSSMRRCRVMRSGVAAALEASANLLSCEMQA